MCLFLMREGVRWQQNDEKRPWARNLNLAYMMYDMKNEGSRCRVEKAKQL